MFDKEYIRNLLIGNKYVVDDSSDLESYEDLYDDLSDIIYRCDIIRDTDEDENNIYEKPSIEFYKDGYDDNGVPINKGIEVLCCSLGSVFLVLTLKYVDDYIYEIIEVEVKVDKE